jgi:signal transduction histidine kinase
MICLRAKNKPSKLRARASTLAHGLKTPLTVMRALAQDLRSGGDVSTIPDEIDYQVTSTQHLVERELARTRDQMSGQVVQCEAEPVLRKLVQAFQRRVGGDDVAWTIDVAPHAVCPFDEFALTELLGNLIDNATKWTGDKIAVSAGGTAIRGFIQVSDNGPGISEAERESVLRRGMRLDETVPGHGLGLSIVQDMVAQRDVDLILSNLPDGGLNARLEWGS